MHRMPLAFFFLFDHASIRVYFEDKENLFYKLQIFPLLKIIERKLMTLLKQREKQIIAIWGFAVEQITFTKHRTTTQ